MCMDDVLLILDIIALDKVSKALDDQVERVTSSPYVSKNDKTTALRQIEEIRKKRIQEFSYGRN